LPSSSSSPWSPPPPRLQQSQGGARSPSTSLHGPDGGDADPLLGDEGI